MFFFFVSILSCWSSFVCVCVCVEEFTLLTFANELNLLIFSFHFFVYLFLLLLKRGGDLHTSNLLTDCRSTTETCTNKYFFFFGFLEKKEKSMSKCVGCWHVLLIVFLFSFFVFKAFFPRIVVGVCLLNKYLQKFLFLPFKINISK